MPFLRALWQKFFTHNADSIQFDASESVKKMIFDVNPLRHLMETRQLIEFSTPLSQRSYQTMILAIDENRGLIWLDELFPPQRLLEVGQKITLKHRRDQEALAVESTIIALGHEVGATGIAIALPLSAHYTPRRKTARTLIDPMLSLNAKLRCNGEEPLYGTVEDLSLGGMRVLIAGNRLKEFSVGSMLPLCELSSDGLHKFRCRALVKGSRICRYPYRGTRVHLQFLDLDQTELTLLNVFLDATIEAQADNRYAA